MDDDPIDPMKEAGKQYFRDNPHKAIEVESVAIWIWIVILGFSAVGALIAKAMYLPGEIAVALVSTITVSFLALKMF